MFGCEIEVLVETEADPCIHRARNRPAQLEVGQAEGQLRTLDKTLDRSARDLAVALRAVSVAGGEERAIDTDRQIEGRATDQLLAVDVATAPARRTGRVDPLLVGRHADHAEERRECDARASIVDGVLTVEPPNDTSLV